MAGPFAYRTTYRSCEDGSTRYVVVEAQGRHELAPTFDKFGTAQEIAEKVTRGDEYCDRIPACPVGTSVPRPRGQVWVPSAEHPTLPQPAASKLRR